MRDRSLGEEALLTYRQVISYKHVKLYTCIVKDLLTQEDLVFTKVFLVINLNITTIFNDVK